MKLVIELDLTKYQLMNGEYDVDCMCTSAVSAIEFAASEGFTEKLTDGTISHAPYAEAGTFRVVADVDPGAETAEIAKPMRTKDEGIGPHAEKAVFKQHLDKM